MVFGEDGLLLYANPEALELSGSGPGQAMPLGAWLAALFPEEPERNRAAQFLRRVADSGAAGGSDSFQASFVDWRGQVHAGSFRVHAWREPAGDARLLVHISPAVKAEPAPPEHGWANFSPGTLSVLAEQVLHLLDEAIGECLKLQAEDATPNPRMLAVMGFLSRARSLLAGTRGLVRAWTRQGRQGAKSQVPSEPQVLDTMGTE